MHLPARPSCAGRVCSCWQVAVREQRRLPAGWLLAGSEDAPISFTEKILAH
jgi:hypothetical protein